MLQNKGIGTWLVSPVTRFVHRADQPYTTKWTSSQIGPADANRDCAGHAEWSTTRVKLTVPLARGDASDSRVGMYTILPPRIEYVSLEGVKCEHSQERSGEAGLIAHRPTLPASPVAPGELKRDRQNWADPLRHLATEISDDLNLGQIVRSPQKLITMGSAPYHWSLGMDHG